METTYRKHVQISFSFFFIFRDQKLPGNNTEGDQYKQKIKITEQTNYESQKKKADLLEISTTTWS